MDNKGPLIVAVAWAAVVLSLAFMALRFWAKIARTDGGLWWDDHILLTSWVLTYATALVNTIMTTLGAGQHVAVVDPANLGNLTLLANVAGTTSILAAQLSKTSFGITLLRIATDTWVKAAVWFAIVTINVAMTVNLLVQWVQCSPAERYWNPAVQGTCWAPGVQSAIAIVMAAYSGGIDILLALIPWKIILGLQMKKAEKIGVASAMSMGVFAGAAACLKAGFIPGLASGDFTYASSELVIFSYVEIGLSIIAASIPALRVLVRDQINSRLGSKGTSGTQNSAVSKKHVLADSRTRRRDSVTVVYD